MALAIARCRHRPCRVFLSCVMAERCCLGGDKRQDKKRVIGWNVRMYVCMYHAEAFLQVASRSSIAKQNSPKKHKN